MAIEFPVGVKVVNPEPVDAISGPYYGDNEAAAIAAANAAVPSAVRFKSLEVRLLIGTPSSVAYKYWYRDGIDDINLVQFSGGGSTINAGSGLTYSSTDTLSVKTDTTYLYVNSTNSLSIATASRGGGGGGTGSVGSIALTLDGQGGVISTGQKGYLQIQYSGTITKWSIITNPAGSIQFDVWKRTNSLPTVANTIVGANYPGVTSSATASSSNLTGWTTTFTDGDYFGWNVRSATTATFARLELVVTKS